MSDRIKRTLTDEDHFVEGFRNRWTTEVLENCHCALWTLSKTYYDYCDVDAIPISVEDFRTKVSHFANLTQAERTQERKYIADGLYHAEGVDIPCPVCGVHLPEEAIDVSNQ